MPRDTVRLETDARGVATLTLARAGKHNAMDAAMIDELRTAADTLTAQAGLRAAVLVAEGPSFCAGGDLGWMRAQMHADRETRMAEARRLAEMLGALDALPVPLIARIEGQAYGGGIGLISVADVALAARPGRFALTETRLGLIPATIAPYVLARLGAARAREVFATARPFDAAEGVRLGLISRAVAPEEMEAAVEAEIAPVLDCAPGAVAAAKALQRRLCGRVGAEEIEATVTALADRWESAEAAAGIEAFFARRQPPWAVDQ